MSSTTESSREPNGLGSRRDVGRFADLHLHTHFSDGTYTPEELAGHAAHFGLAAVALTDHDTVEGCAGMATACGRRGIEFIPGAELTAEVAGAELHIIGYFLDANDSRLSSALRRFQEGRQERVREMVSRLNRVSVPIRAEAVFAIADCRSPGRPHVARALVQQGICSSLDEAFERFLKKGRPGWAPKCRMSGEEAIDLIHGAGGMAVLAHPGLTRRDELIEGLARAELDGIECFHSKHSPSARSHYVALAEKHHLLVTGGSDCHGMNKGEPLIGSVRLPYRYVDAMKAARARRFG